MRNKDAIPRNKVIDLNTQLCEYRLQVPPFLKTHRLKWISLDTNGKTGQVRMTSNGPQASLL